FDRLPGFQIAQVQRGVTCGHTDLQKVWFLILQLELGPGAGTHERSCTDLQLQISAGTGVQCVAGRHGRIDLCWRPVLGPGTPERHLTAGETEAWWCAFSSLLRLRLSLRRSRLARWWRWRALRRWRWGAFWRCGGSAFCRWRRCTLGLW